MENHWRRALRGCGKRGISRSAAWSAPFSSKKVGGMSSTIRKLYLKEKRLKNRRIIDISVYFFEHFYFISKKCSFFDMFCYNGEEIKLRSVYA